MTFAGILVVVALTAVSVWYTRRLVALLRADGYGLRATSGLPRDWSPSCELPSTSYVEKPHY